MPNSTLRSAFENVAAHISNLEELKILVEEIENKSETFESALIELESKLEDAEVTFRTDIRILINEYRHLGDRTTPR